MKRDEIEDAICNILITDGPDGHTDGSNIIVDFIEALLAGNGPVWIKKYSDKHELDT